MRLKSCLKFISELLQFVIDNVNLLQENGNYLCFELNFIEKVLKYEVCDGNLDLKDRIFDEDVLISKQSQFNLFYLLNLLQLSLFENLQNQWYVGLEFLKICFLDVDCDLMNVILIVKGGDLMKVVDELFMCFKVFLVELLIFLVDLFYFVLQ